jgi:hypothetical protein
MLRAYLSKKLTRPLPTKDGGTLRTVADGGLLRGDAPTTLKVVIGERPVA